MMETQTIHVRKEYRGHCAYINCRRKGAYIFTENGNGLIGFYPVCRRHFRETVDMRNWTDECKAEWKELQS